MRAHGDGRDFDFFGDERIDDRGRRRAWVAVADDDHVLHGRVGDAFEALDSKLKSRIEVWHVARRHLVESGEHGGALTTDALHATLPKPAIGAVPLNDAAVILVAERLDGGLGDFGLPEITLGH